MAKSLHAALLMALLLSLGHGLKAQQSQPAQDTAKTAITLGLQSHYGFIIPHSNTLKEIADSNPYGVEIDLGFHFTSLSAYSYLEAYPRLGATFAYYNFDNPDVIGSAYAMMLYAEPFFAAHRDFSLSFRLGGGLTYMTNPYDEETNPQNLFYSTSLSFPLTANLMGNYKLTDRLTLRGGFAFTHISNGGRSQPNKGINFPTATLGAYYAVRPASFPKRQPIESFHSGPDHGLHVALIGGYKDRNDNNDKQLPVLGAVAVGSQRIGRLSALTLGAEWVADFTIRKRLQLENIDKDFQRGALLAGHELRFGRVRFSQQLGVYIYAPYKAKDPVYQRYGLEYQTKGKLFFGVNLKAHRHVADFLDLRVGLRLI